MFLLQHGLPDRYGERPAHGARPGQLPHREPMADDAEIVEALAKRLSDFGAGVLVEEALRPDPPRLGGPDA